MHKKLLRYSNLVESRLASGSFAYYKMKTLKFSPVRLKACLFKLASQKY